MGHRGEETLVQLWVGLILKDMQVELCSKEEVQIRSSGLYWTSRLGCPQLAGSHRGSWDWVCTGKPVQKPLQEAMRANTSLLRAKRFSQHGWFLHGDQLTTEVL